jgi:hypothetical protein
MNVQKIIIGGIIGGIVLFFLGWLVYGMLLMDFMAKNSRSNPEAFRSETEMVWWAMIGGNLVMGMFYSYVIHRIGTKTMSAGAITGATVAFLMSLGYNLMLYAQLDLWGKTAMAADVAASVVMGAIVGAVIGWWNGRGSAN